MLGSAAAAATDVICANTLALKRTYQGTASQPVPNAPEFRKALATLAAEFAALEQRNATPALQRISQTLSGAARIAESGGGTEATLFQTLSALDQLDDIFGCTDTPLSKTTGAAENALNTDGSPTQLRLENSRSGLLTKSAWLMALCALMALAAGLLCTRRRREGRKMCNTSLLIVYGDQCTVTHIVDIARDGMKIEAAQKAVAQVWADLYFCGHKIRGKIVWRNASYAGIKFKSRISRQTLQDVLC